MAPKPGKREYVLPGKKQKKAKFFKRHHGFLAVIIVCGWLVPPLAILIRFGIGFDFFLNIILTIAGYFPGHAHNFYCQNIRNNQGRGRSPKWALKSGLVQDDTEYIKSTRQWGNRYNERNNRNIYDDDSHPYEDEHGNVIPRNHTDGGRDPNAAEDFIERHAGFPAQPNGGLGDRGNDLLADLPDEEAEQRRRQKVAQQKAYGQGLDDRDAFEEEMRRESANGGAGITRRSNGLVDDIDDPDRALYSSSRTKQPTRQDSSGSATYGLGPRKGKSGRSKKSERYGLAEDHKDIGVSGYGKSQNSIAQRKQAERDRAEFASNNPYASSNGQPARRNDADEDFLNHQF